VWDTALPDAGSPASDEQVRSGIRFVPGCTNREDAFIAAGEQLGASGACNQTSASIDLRVPTVVPDESYPKVDFPSVSFWKTQYEFGLAT
jgi:hypothetical protein